MDTRNPINYPQMATGKSAQIHRASRGSKCPLAQKACCQRVLWCDDAVKAQREIDHKRRSGKEIYPLRRLGASQPKQDTPAANPPLAQKSYFWRRASRSKTLKQLQGYQPARSSTLPNHARVARLLRVSLLQVLEFEESLWRVRCWLLRSCIGSFLRASNKAKQYLTSGEAQR